MIPRVFFCFSAAASADFRTHLQLIIPGKQVNQGREIGLHESKCG